MFERDSNFDVECFSAVGMEIPIRIPMSMGMGWYGDCDESPRVYGDSVGIFEWMCD